ncbi:MAG: hypothetical protein A2Y79_08490 [Deltaproteobacteria bacterium RBG_13_43_22]|nr:MAG: hypothetical protein A2Y79_08490 [Deltaproteobacteria bacterium RBG_13_43_22]
MPFPKVVYYISGHGYGHAVRSIQIINELIKLGCKVIIKTTTPVFLFKEGLSRPVEILFEGFDVGLEQIDNIRFDLEKTKKSVIKLLASAEERIRKEQKFFSDQGISGIVCDIPFIPLAAAGRLGLPSVGISNFSWDWIYAHYGKWDPEWYSLSEAIRGYYREGDLLLRLPFYGKMEAFRRIEDIPLVTRRSEKEKDRIRLALDLPQDRKIGLVGFSQVELHDQGAKKIEQLSSEYLFLIRPPLNLESNIFRKVEGGEFSFIDLVCAADLVITKAGYGIVADCLSHGTPMIYSDRGEFPEYPILVEGIKSHLSCCYMPKEDLYSGNWESYLERLSSQPRIQPEIRTDGAQVAARRILEWMEIRKGP